MKLSIYFGTLILFLNIGCNQTDIKVKRLDSNKTERTGFVDNGITEIIFGVYCGLCIGHCATMYQYNMSEYSNADTFLVDTTDGFFKDGGKFAWSPYNGSEVQYRLPISILNNIPKKLLQSNKTSEKFGCPDCRDQCGVYFKVVKDNMPREFYLDYDTSELPNDLKLFTELIKLTTAKLYNTP